VMRKIVEGPWDQVELEVVRNSDVVARYSPGMAIVWCLSRHGDYSPFARVEWESVRAEAQAMLDAAREEESDA
jgi:hypothetical protein